MLGVCILYRTMGEWMSVHIFVAWVFGWGYVWVDEWLAELMVSGANGNRLHFISRLANN